MLPRTLFGRLLLVFLGFGIVMTGALLVIMQGSHRHYHRQADQAVNRRLADNFVATNFLTRDLPLTGPTLHRELARLSSANPAVDIYLIDGMGRLIAASVPRDQWMRQQIALDPLRRFLAGAKLPLLADDPRDPRRREIFSVARIDIRDCPAKYLYVVLHRGEFAAGTTRLRKLYALGEGAGFLLLAALLAVTLSLGVLRWLTQRLGVLEQRMRQFLGGETDAAASGAVPGGGASGDEVDRLAGLFKDLADRVRFQVRVLESTDLMRREMLANVSHDLRTPLTTLQTYLETLATPPPGLTEAERHEYTLVALRQSRRLTALVEQLLEAAKLDAGQVVPQIEPFPIGELVYDVAMKFALAATKRDVRIIVDALPGAPWVMADIGLIERVLDNLIDNALRHSPQGGTVFLELTAQDEGVRVGVRDTGPGVSEQDRQRIFDRFYRKDRGRATGGGHAGLGLAIVRSILDLHRTGIHVDGGRGAGAYFWFELPVQAPVTPRAPSTAGGTDAMSDLDAPNGLAR
jgi:two-component system, OmpR family, sensor kinase